MAPDPHPRIPLTLKLASLPCPLQWPHGPEFRTVPFPCRTPGTFPKVEDVTYRGLACHHLPIMRHPSHVCEQASVEVPNGRPTAHATSHVGLSPPLKTVRHPQNKAPLSLQPLARPIFQPSEDT